MKILKMQGLTALFAVAVLVLAACGGDPIATAAPSTPASQPAPSVTPVADPIATATPSPTAEPTVTAAPTATATPTAEPTVTATPTAEPTVTATPTAEPTLTPTPEHSVGDGPPETLEEDSPQAVDQPTGVLVYGAVCARCHGPSGTGTGRAPSLIGIGQFFPDDASPIRNLVANGGDNMPAFGAELTSDQIEAVVQYVVETYQ